MKKRLLSLLCTLALCLGLLPTTALAAAEGEPDKLYVGNQAVIVANTVTYWTTDNSGGLTRVDDATDDSNNWNVKYDPNTATLTLNGATIDGGEYSTPHYGAGIYAQCSSNQSVTLTIELIGTNTITGNYGIYVDAQQGGNVGANASLTITGNGSLEVSGSSYGISIKSGTGNASLTINNASVKANTTSTFSYFAGVYVMSSSNATGSPKLSLAVNGGSLTASGGTSSDGIQFYVGDPDATNAITSLTVSGNAIVDARTGGIKATRVSTDLLTPTPTGENSSGIVFDGTEGTVYGDVTLDEPLTVGEGETLTIPQGSTLNGNSNLTNNGTVTIENGGTLNGSDTINNTGTINVENGGKLEGEPTGTVVYAPVIITESPLPEGTVGTAYSQPLAADNNPTQWTVTGGTLPAGLALDPTTGIISGTPTTEGTSTFTVTAENSAGSASKEYTLNIKPATVSVTSVKLDKTELPLVVGGTAKLTATVEPADATNKSVTWESSNPDVATVDQSGNVKAVTPGTATITATANNGSGQKASCTVTVTQPVTGVSLDKNELDLFTGENATLTAKVEPDNATNQKVSWTSDKPDVATVDQNGKVTAVAAGQATITVTTADGDKQATCKVKVTQATYNISVEGSLGFGEAYTGCDRPTAKTVTITNTGNQPLTLTQPASTANFEVGTLSATELPVGGKVTFTVQPKAGLPVGTYKENIVVSADHDVKLTIPASFTVRTAPAPSATPAPATPAPADNTTYYTCPACGTHNWTATDNGYRCDNCGYLESVKQLSGYGNVKGTYTPGSTPAPKAAAAGALPQTGDASNLPLWGGLAVVCVLVLGGIILYKRKRG